jgi:lipopolysaccharide biosynthesis glycosyltransferase
MKMMSYSCDPVLNLLIVIVLLVLLSSSQASSNLESSTPPGSLSDDSIHIATTICGVVNNVLARGLLASLMLNPQAKRISLYVLFDPANYASIQDKSDFKIYQERLRQVKIFNVDDLKNQTHVMPQYETGRYSCAHMRLFYSEYFPEIDYILYIDTDALVLGDLNDIWKYSLNHQIFRHKSFGAALDLNVPEAKRMNYPPHYLNKAKKHFYFPTGINTGVLLMNLRRMRAHNITGESLQRLNDENVQYADQDILNTFAYYQPEEIFVLPCHWNKRYYSKCNDISTEHYFQNDTGILHGCNHEFLNSRKELRFGYDLWEHYENEYTLLTNSSMDAFPDGTMLQVVGQRSVFYMDEGKRRQMNGINTLISLGLDFDQVQIVSESIMNRIPLGDRLYDKAGVHYLQHQPAASR